MDIGLLLKVAGVGILVSVTCQILSRTGREEQATFVSIAGIIIVLAVLVTELGALVETIRSVFGF